MPEVHRVASLLKRWLLGTHQGAVSREQLDYDSMSSPSAHRRRSRHRGLLFYRLLEQVVATDPHPYKALKASGPPDQAPPEIGGSEWIAHFHFSI